jgi:hypothetical protein
MGKRMSPVELAETYREIREMADELTALRKAQYGPLRKSVGSGLATRQDVRGFLEEFARALYADPGALKARQAGADKTDEPGKVETGDAILDERLNDAATTFVRARMQRGVFDARNRFLRGR